MVIFNKLGKFIAISLFIILHKDLMHNLLIIPVILFPNAVLALLIPMCIFFV